MVGPAEDSCLHATNNAGSATSPSLLAQPTSLVGLVRVLAQLSNTDNIPQRLALVLVLGQVVELQLGHTSA